MVLSKATLWESGHDETVEVNQRALIDKVLARYSGEFTVFRELLQNSDDAQSKAVEIRFETQSYLDRRGGEGVTLTSDGPLPDLKNTTVYQWTFKNNGIAFRDEDWSRLKKIAEGNPDEEKIGAFGVGFYSLFSVTEEPFVSSGEQWMGFYWKDKKDQLFARRGQLPPGNGDDQSKLWTTFTMALRDPSPMPSAFDLTRFLASSITFMRHLSEIVVYFDDKRLVKLNKASGLPCDIPIPRGYNNRSPEKTMTVTGIASTPVVIQAEVMKWIYTSGTKRKSQPIARLAKTIPSTGFFSVLYSSFAKAGGGGFSRVPMSPVIEPETLINPLEISQTGVSLSIFSATVQVNLDKKMTAELLRSTKKNPPSKMKIELIYTSKDEYDASLKEDAQLGTETGSIFQGLRADIHKYVSFLDNLDAAEGDPNRSGDSKVFIGHSTSQSTGLGGHIAARFIPTVERESIDFMDRYVTIWNKELLYAGGFLARAAYDNELRIVQQQWDAACTGSALPSQEIQSQLIGRVVHALKFFDFYESQPSKEVTAHLREAFFASSSSAIFQIMSSMGVRMAKGIRLPDPLLSVFMKNIPMLPDEILATNSSIIDYLKYAGMIRNVEFPDMIQELQSRPLTLDECASCLNWWITESRRDLPSNRDNYLSIRTQFLNAVVIVINSKDDDGGKILPLNSIKYFFNTKSQLTGSIPTDGPLPDSLLPIPINKGFKAEEMNAYFPWAEFNLRHWLSHICNSGSEAIPPEYNICLSPPWSEKVFGVISRGWSHLSEESKANIKDILHDKTCIPTTNGMTKPAEAYFPNVNIFPDLPVVKFPSNVLIRGNIERLLQYLDVRKHVDLQLIFNRMIKTNEWTVTDLIKYLVSIRDLDEEEVKRLRNTSAFPKEMKPDETFTKRPRFMANQLYPPIDVLRALGLPILDWGDQIKWREKSEEAKFLYKIGLQRHPPLKNLIELCAGSHEEIRLAAFQYLIDHIETEYALLDPSEDQAFIPALKASEPCLARIKQVYSYPAWSSMGFYVLQAKYQPYAAKLKIKEHPTAGELVSLLQTKPPSNTTEAATWFRLLASRVNDFRPSDLERLSTTPFVPIAGEKTGSPRWLPPSQCYLRGETKETFHSQLFTFVDFGASANAFLSACGAKNQPSVEEVAKILLNDPHHFYDLSGGPVNFLTELRNLAVNARSLSNGTILRMKKSPIFLGIKRKSRVSNKTSDDWEEDEWEMIYDLKRPSEIVIADDTNAYQAFGDSLFAAPQEDILEGFYNSLGSQRLSRLVREEYQTSAEITSSKIGQETRGLILERLPLFLHEHTHTETRVSFSWFSSGNNFIVKTFGKLTVMKHLNFGNAKVTKKQDASAVSLRHGSGSIELWIAGNAQIDMYEVATSLNRLLFESPKTNDALLFMTILSTDLRSLKRRGYNVERILRQQREARLAAAAEAERIQKETRLATKPLMPSDTETSSLFSTDAQTLRSTGGPSGLSALFNRQVRRRTGPASTEQLSPPAVPEKISTVPLTPPPHPPAESPASKALPDQPLLNGDYKLNKQYLSTAKQSPPGPPGPPAGEEDDDKMPGGLPPIGNNAKRGTSPRSNISRNIDLAIDSCKPEFGNLLLNRERMQQVKETMEDGYCDVSGRKENLHNIAEMGSIKIYLSDEIPLKDAESFMERKQASIARFIHIMRPLATIFRLPLSSLHIFYDLKGNLVACNRDGSIFLNLRYYEQWHDAKVSRGDLRAAYISWYFSIAHEIAHNLVHPHNSEHEFYFSEICQQFMLDLTKLMTGTST